MRIPLSMAVVSLCILFAGVLNAQSTNNKAAIAPRSQVNPQKPVAADWDPQWQSKEAEGELKALLEHYTEQHPIVRAKRIEIDGLRHRARQGTAPGTITRNLLFTPEDAARVKTFHPFLTPDIEYRFRTVPLQSPDARFIPVKPPHMPSTNPATKK